MTPPSNFIVEPVTLRDFATFEEYDEKTTGTLVAPALSLTWPLDDSNPETKARNQWSIDQQRWQFQNDATARFVKAVDRAGGEPVALARWHHYPQGFPLDSLYMEVDVYAPPGTEPNLPAGMNAELHTSLLRSLCGMRPEWQQPGPCWVLTTVVTRRADRKQGAASVLLEWGLAQAAREGVPRFALAYIWVTSAYLEALPDAKGLYEKHGFESIPPKPGHDEVIATMIARPK